MHGKKSGEEKKQIQQVHPRKANIANVHFSHRHRDYESLLYAPDKTPPRMSKACSRSKEIIGKQENRHKTASSKKSRSSVVAEISLTTDLHNSSFKDHAARIVQVATVLWRKKHLHDVVLAVGHHRIGAHKLVLAACSEYFCELFTSEEDDPNTDGGQFVYTLHGVSPEIVRILLESMYTSSLRVTYENIDELLNAALYLRIQTTLDLCTKFLLDNLITETCLQTLSVAVSFDMDDIIEEASLQVARNFMELSMTLEFLDLAEESFLCLVSRDDLHVDNELEVFHACLRWLESDISGRLPHLVQVLQRIRLPMIKPTEIVDFIESVPYIMKNSQCETLVNEALHYHCLPHRQSVLQSSRTIPRSQVSFVTVIALGGQPRKVKDPVHSDVMYYNPVTSEWKILTHMEQPRHHHAATSYGGFLYVAGGRETTSSSSPLRTVHRYDPRTSVWLQVANMLDARESFQLAILHGKIYAVGGRVDDHTSLSAVERYDPYHDVWETVDELSDPRRCVAVACYSGRLYAMGGSGNQKISSKVESYDPEKNKWEMRGQLSIPRFFSVLLSYGDHLYLAGGATVDSTGSLRCIAHIEKYDPLTDTWTKLAAMTTPRAESAACVLDGCIYVIGGYNWEEKSWLRSVEMYDIEKEAWSLLTDFPLALTGMSSCTLKLYHIPA